MLIFEHKLGFVPYNQHLKWIKFFYFQGWQSSPPNFKPATMQIQTQPMWHPAQLAVFIPSESRQ
jgi:hypothetical protein